MINGKRVLAVVPARGGSKGLPGKNVRLVGGKPLLAWSVEVGLASRYVDKLAVSTDASDIAEVSRAAGAEVPFLRPAALASDTASSIDVLLHCIDFYHEQGLSFDLLALLEPTSPLREVSDVERALELLTSMPEAESVVSVCRSEGGHPVFLYNLGAKQKLTPFSSEAGQHIRRQDLSPVFFPEGTMYAAKIESLRARRSFYHHKTYAYEVPRWKALEIDEISDLVCADALLKYRITNIL